jgi:hypothetical protein
MVMSDIHQIAERFLRDPFYVETPKKFSFYMADTPELIATPQHITRVVIVREEAPIYLAAIKPSGRPVWTHDMKYAASYDSNSERLEHVLDRMAQYQISVETMPACWFSNHQYERGQI